MHALTGPDLSRRVETTVRSAVAVAAIFVVIAPVLYVVLLPAACVLVACAAPRGRRMPAAMAVWFPVSAAVFLGTTNLLV